MDQEAVREHQSDGSWFGYADEERTRLLSIDAMSEAPFYYTNMRDHILQLRNAVEEAIPGVPLRVQRAGFDPCGRGAYAALLRLFDVNDGTWPGF